MSVTGRRVLGCGVVTTVLVGTCAVAWASTLAVTAQRLGGGSPAAPALYPVSISLNNVSNKVGQVQKDDTAVFVWSEPVDQTTVCSGWSNAVSTHSVSADWVIRDNAAPSGNDLLQVSTTPAGCTGGLHIGTVDLGSTGYVTADVSWAGASTSLVVSGGTTTVTLTFPTASGGVNPNIGTVSSGSAASWVPDPLTADLSARTCGASTAHSSTTVQF